jgi:hypothetical protein
VRVVLRNAYLRASVRRRAHPSKKFSLIQGNTSNRRSERFLSQTSASFVSHWEVGAHQCDKKVIKDEVELNDVQPNGNTSKTTSKKKMETKKSSSPQSRKCLLYKSGGMTPFRWKDPLFVSENGTNNQSNNKHKESDLNDIPLNP